MSMPSNKNPRRRRRVDTKSGRHQTRGFQRRCYTVERDSKKGYESENTVRELLYILRREGLIDRFKQTAEWSKEDKEGVDFIIWYRGYPVPLQVKSSHRKMLDHYQFTRTHKPAVNARCEHLRDVLLRRLRWYVARQLPVLEIGGDPETMTTPYPMSTMACYYMTEVFRATLAGGDFDSGPHQDVDEALQPLVNISLLERPEPKKYRLTQGGYECVKWILEQRDEPKRYFMNQCKRFGPTNWKQTTEGLFGYRAVMEKKSPLIIPEGTAERMFWERKVY